MYKNILIPVIPGDEQGSARSIAAARALADDGARFTLLHVVETIPGYVASLIPEQALSQSREDLEAAMDAMVAGLPGAGTAIASGHAGKTIVEHARAHGVDCIVMTSHTPGFEDLFIGSTADRVVRHARCSVHVIR